MPIEEWKVVLIAREWLDIRKEGSCCVYFVQEEHEQLVSLQSQEPEQLPMRM